MSEAARDLAMARFRLIQPYFGTQAIPALGRSRCQSLLSDRPKMGKPVSQACYRMTNRQTNFVHDLNAKKGALVLGLRPGIT